MNSYLFEINIRNEFSEKSLTEALEKSDLVVSYSMKRKNTEVVLLKVECPEDVNVKKMKYFIYSLGFFANQKSSFSFSNILSTFL